MRLSILLLLALFLYPIPGRCQTGRPPAPDTLAPPPAGRNRPRFPIQSIYDASADSTTVSLVLEKGRHFVHFHRPRITVAFSFPGQYRAPPPESMLVEFRTQSPQYTATNLLQIRTDAGTIMLARATNLRIRQRTFTTDHTLTFIVPLDRFLPVLGSPAAELEVGGVRVKLKAKQLDGLRELMNRMAVLHSGDTPAP